MKVHNGSATMHAAAHRARCQTNVQKCSCWTSLAASLIARCCWHVQLPTVKLFLLQFLN